MIDTSKEFWTGSDPADIDTYLRVYTQDPTLEIKPVLCSICGCTELRLVGDQDEGAVQAVCMQCGAKKLLLDSAEYWKEVSHRTLRCPLCKGKGFNARVGLSRRENGQVRWVWIGDRCTQCQVLGSPFDWRIDYEPTDEMEKNI